MIRTFFALLLLVSIQTPSAGGGIFDVSDLLKVHPIPVLKGEAFSPSIEAKAGLVMDYETGLVLYEKNIHSPLPMASLTKIMTAVLILENHDLSEVVTVSSNFSGIEGVKIWLKNGEQLTVESLLKALLIPSAGDAALALAEFHSGSVAKFVEEMNARAKTMNLLHTHFTNPIGLDDDGHFSSAYDLAILSKYALHFRAFRDIVRMQEAAITSVDGKQSHEMQSTNYLLNSYLNILGVKTGTTDAAGESLINLAANDDGRRIIAIVLNSPKRFQENKSMIDWGFRNYKW